MDSNSRHFDPRTSHIGRLLVHFSRRRSLVILFFISLACLSMFSVWNSVGFTTPEITACWFGCTSTANSHSLSSVNGPPTKTFKDNLRSDTKYITSFGSGGWSNDVIGHMHLIYLGLITDRVPIVSLFPPTHIGQDKDAIGFAEIFDLDRLQIGVGKPVLDWPDVKDPNSDVLEDIGCWNVWGSCNIATGSTGTPRHSFVPDHLKLDISYTKTPDWVKLIPGFEHDQHSTFWSLATLAFPAARAESLVPALPSPVHNVSLPPDEHLLCYDFLYYVVAHKPYEIEEDYSPAWRYAGQHMHFLRSLSHLADQYVRRALAIEGKDPTPPFISIHVRHGDFGDWCNGVPVEQCFAPLPVFARRVREVQADILERKGITVKHVVMTSDEQDEAWWRQVAEMGWKAIDHSQTEETHGPWYPVLIDTVVQSQGLGFVGTARSTMSMLARRRVESWHDGTGVMVKWGKPDADDH